MRARTAKRREKGEVLAGNRGVRLLPDTTERPRSSAFVEKVNEKCDKIVIDTPEGEKTVTITAISRTFYWAILCFMYTNHSRHVAYDELCDGVRAMMIDHAIEKWERFISRRRVPSHSRNPLKRKRSVSKRAQSWKQRLVTNARNLCRIGSTSKNAYGKRLLPSGHVMRHETTAAGERFFIMHLTLTPENTSERQRGRKKAVAAKVMTEIPK